MLKLGFSIHNGLPFKKQDQTLLWTCVAGARRCVNSRYAKFKVYRNEIRLHPNFTMLSTVGDLTISKLNTQKYNIKYA